MIKMEYIFFEKKQNTIKSDKVVKQDIQRAFGITWNDVFSVAVKRTNVELRYTLEKRKMDISDDNVYYMTLFTNEKYKKRAVEALEETHLKMIQNGEIRKKYHVVVLSDDVSSYYCVKAYPVFHEYEKQIRRLVYKLLTMSLGAMWIDKTVDEELKKQLKERKNSISGEKLIAQMLHEMDMSQLEQYLFDPRREVSASDMIDECLSDVNTESMTKEEIVATIQRARPQSVWEKYFANHIEVEDLQSKMIIVRANRNKVAHCKPFYSNDFYDSMKILKDEGLIIKLTSAIENIRTRELSLVTARDVFQGLLDFGKFFKAASIIATPFLIEWANLVQFLRNDIVIPGISRFLNEITGSQKQVNEFAMNPAVSSIVNQTKDIGNTLGASHLNTLMNQTNVEKRLLNDSFLQSFQKADQLNKLLNIPLMESLQRTSQFNKLYNVPLNGILMREENACEIFPNEGSLNKNEDINENGDIDEDILGQKGDDEQDET